MKHINASDLAMVTVPPAVGVSLSQVNLILGCVSLIIGIAFQLWKWRRDAKQK